ncbi:Tyrosine--tRNA ligase [Candidatus Nasuia deltocephalinicola]|nr:Tyrosine--tRNA ligase [Candidatus Nasuia deltocephalinicola]
MIKNFILEKTILFLFVIKYNCFEFLNDFFFLKKIFKKFFLKKKINLKFGIDPTSNIIHLGHINIINKIIQLKKINFKIIIIIGNFTSFIGDPSYNDKSRICNNKKIISLNISYFLYQLNFIINFSKNLFIYYNIEWLSVLNIFDLINLLYLINLNKIFFREDLKKRYNSSIFIPELIYPIIQSYDSVFIKSDIEIGGIDQKLNFFITRELQKKIKIFSELLILFPLIIGLDGKSKMSKSKFNFLSFKDKFINFFNKLFFLKKNKIIYYYLNISYIKRKNNFKIYFMKKKDLIFNLINIFLNKKNIFFFIKNLYYINILKIKIFYLFIYKFLKKINLIISYNKGIYFIKSLSIKINNIFLKNFNFLFLKGKYFLLLNKKKYFLILY